MKKNQMMKVKLMDKKIRPSELEYILICLSREKDEKKALALQKELDEKRELYRKQCEEEKNDG